MSKEAMKRVLVFKPEYGAVYRVGRDSDYWHNLNYHVVDHNGNTVYITSDCKAAVGRCMWLSNRQKQLRWLSEVKI